uniref:Uncharacterized protein n=1 Tax=Anguilla anguilla TaxID=7936 RepID=A0A0E9X209_ANGAN
MVFQFYCTFFICPDHFLCSEGLFRYQHRFLTTSCLSNGWHIENCGLAQENTLQTTQEQLVPVLYFQRMYIGTD